MPRIVPTRSFVIAAALLLGVAVAAPPVVAQGRPDCAAVVRAMHKLKKRGGGRTLDSARIAIQLDTDSAWVERCAASYGRRIHAASRQEPDQDVLSARREAEEYEELAREEMEQFANRVQEDLRDGVYANRNKGHGPNPDSSAEWEPFITHEWRPYVTHEWTGPFIRDDDDPGFD